MTLEDLMKSLDSKAMTKEASEEVKTEGTGGEDDLLVKKDSEWTKQAEAHAEGAALAQEVMQKVASLKTTAITQTKSIKEQEMNKQASIAGKALAEALLEKLAGAGDQNTENGIYEGAVPNRSQVDLAQMEAEDAARIQVTPGTDGAGNGGTVNEIFDAIVADAMGHGAAAYEHQGQAPASGAEGVVEDTGAPAQEQTEEQEKVAAVVALVDSGIDFDSAVSLVKQAEAEIQYEEEQHVKQAAMAQLINSGVDFELAAALVKSASLGGMVTRARRFAQVNTEKARRAAGEAGDWVSGKTAPAREWVGEKTAPAVDWVKGHANNLGNDFRALRQGEVGGDSVITVSSKGTAVPQRAGAAGRVAKNPLVLAGAGTLALGGAGTYYATREKQAAVAGLVERGVDFDTAVDLVNAKAQELGR